MTYLMLTTHLWGTMMMTYRKKWTTNRPIPDDELMTYLMLTTHLWSTVMMTYFHPREMDN